MAAIDPAKTKLESAFNHGGTFYSLAGDGKGKLYAGSDDFGVHVFDPRSAKKEPLARWARHDNYVSALGCVERAGKRLVISGSYDRRLVWWDAAGGQVVRAIEAHEGWVRDLVVVPGGNLLASAGDDMRVKLWETDSGRLVRSLEGHALRTPQGHVTALYALAVSPDGKYLASGDRIGSVRVWELATGKLAQSFEVPTLYTYDPRQRKRSIGGIRALAFSPDGASLAAGGIGQVGNVDGLEGPAHVEVWDWRKPERRFAATAQGHKGMIESLLFEPSGTWLIACGGGSDNGFLAFWKTDATPMPAGQDKKPAPVPTHRIKTDGHLHRLVLSPTGTELYAAGYRKLTVWTLGM
jgi:WD40 repeat protein